ncbi:hypothetical protein [Sphingomonas morindae]|uniref:Uncharacterized protein n=1 Tax=Sphingomonas morindae TaxID=1541170 RepID=A0ABY4X765_9SPHN|nr:hypothetical protein [Sphingomonas morindae]USI72694.1 hypothetical protein LHA26_15665 [Sphingomonas morindae]
MTKPRAPLSFAQAVALIAGRVGYARLAHLVGRSERAVRYWSESECRTTPSLGQAKAMDLAWRAAGGAGFPMLESYARQLHSESLAARACAAGLAEDLAAVARETADAIATGIAVTRPGAGAGAIRHAIAEAEEASGATTRLLGRLKSFLSGTSAGRAERGSNL